MNYTIHEYEDSYQSINDIEVTEFPSHDQLFYGVPINTGYYYVSHTYLNGFINYVKIHKAYMTFEYGYNERDETLKQIESISEKQWYHTNLGQFGESVIVLGELDDSYIIFIFDGDVSDCGILRYSKDKYSFGEIERETICLMQYRQKFENPECNEYVELPLPEGWVKY